VRQHGALPLVRASAFGFARFCFRALFGFKQARVAAKIGAMRFLLALLCTLVLASCSDTARYRIDPDARPALWQLQSADGALRGYLFGTVHLLPDGVNWRSDRLTAAMNGSGILVIEVLGADDPDTLSAAFKALAFSPGLPPVADRLPADLKDSLAAAKQGTGLGGLMLNRMESWAAALTLASAQHEKLGLDRDDGVETALLASFRAAGKPIRGLETISEQLGAFDRLPEADQRLMLRDVVADRSDARAQFQILLSAWASGDEAALAKQSQGGMMDHPRIRDAVLVARNAAWARRIDAMLKRGDRPFIAVGAGHLVGPDNVRAMLETMGYKAVRVQ
jgi:uncharacterized protein YbaP (TraB family)